MIWWQVVLIIIALGGLASIISIFIFYLVNILIRDYKVIKHLNALAKIHEQKCKNEKEKK